MSILANQMSTADTAVEVLTIPTGRRTTFNINAVNTGSDIATVSGGTAAATATIDIVLEPRHIFEHAVALNPGGILYRTALILGPGDRLYAQADTDTVALTAWGVSALI